MIKRISKNTLGLAGALLASFFVLASCGKSDKGLTYIYVAEDFGSVAIKGGNTVPEKGISEDFQLFVLDASGALREGQVPLVGSYSQESDGLYFTPSFPFAAGKTYRARFKLESKWLERDFFVKDIDRVPVSGVEAVYPSGNQLPRNILKFYIQFTDSMASGFAYENIHFLTDAGDTLKDVFLPLEQELWSPDMKRFTLLLDPGRIKQGLQSMEELGYAFQSNRKYKMVVDKNWHDAHDRPLTNGFEKLFTILPDQRALAGSFNIINHPAAGSTEAVVMRSKVPHDYALLHSAITLTDKDGNIVPGTIALDSNETVWKYTPDAPWQKRQYQIRMANILEDVAGNNLKNLFDVDNRQTQTVTNPGTINYWPLSFWPK